MDWDVPNVEGRFVLGPLVGRGSQGDVYRALWSPADAPEGTAAIAVALKIYPGHALHITKHRLAIEREVGSARAIGNHPHVVQALGLTKLDKRLAAVFEWVEGTDLSELVRRIASPRAAMEALAQVAEGLQHVHEAGFVHRDVKPSNVRVARSGPAKVVDFGWVARRGDTPSPSGTLLYVAPEQLQDGTKADPAQDVFALGASAYTVQTGRHLRTGLHDLRERTRETSVNDVLRLTPPPYGADLLRAMMADDPARRPSMATVMARLQELVPTLPGPSLAEGVHEPRPSPRWMGSREGQIYDRGRPVPPSLMARAPTRLRPDRLAAVTSSTEGTRSSVPAIAAPPAPLTGGPRGSRPSADRVPPPSPVTPRTATLPTTLPQAGGERSPLREVDEPDLDP